MSAGGASEFDLIRWIRSVTPSSPDVPIGIGDDCACVLLKSARCLLKIDQTVEGVHYDPARASLAQVGHKALARPLSDFAAMAGLPRAAVVSALLPSAFPADGVRAIYRAMQDLAQRFEVRLVGGDLAVGGDRLALSVAVVGESNPRGDVTRSGAKAGDAIFVTGELGGSILGKHLDFVPRIREALALAEAVRLNAMIDLSDGLAADLGHLCEESAVGAVLCAEAIPIAEAARRLAAQSGRPALDHALNDGEDYELLFTVSPALADRVPRTLGEVRVSRIGEVAAERGLWLDDQGGPAPIVPRGWTHRLA